MNLLKVVGNMLNEFTLVKVISSIHIIALNSNLNAFIFVNFTF